MIQQDTSRWAIWLISLAALLAAIIPLPNALDILRPDLLALVIIWFAVMQPRARGLGYAWCAGLAMDAMRGPSLGEHALTYVVVAYIAHRTYLRFRMFPLGQQCLFVMVMLGAQEALLFWIDGVTGHAMLDWRRWLPMVTGAIVWPVVASALKTLASKD